MHFFFGCVHFLVCVLFPGKCALFLGPCVHFFSGYLFTLSRAMCAFFLGLCAFFYLCSFLRPYAFFLWPGAFLGPYALCSGYVCVFWVVCAYSRAMCELFLGSDALLFGLCAIFSGNLHFSWEEHTVHFFTLLILGPLVLMFSVHFYFFGPICTFSLPVCTIFFCCFRSVLS